MYNTRHLIILTAFLLTLGLGLFLYKFLWLGLPLKPDAQTPIWNIEAELTFYANRPVRATLFVPPDQENFKLNEENFVAHLAVAIGFLNGRVAIQRVHKLYIIKCSLTKLTIFLPPAGLAYR